MISIQNYGVTFPDIIGCFSAGTSIEEAISMAQEAAECHIEGLLLDSEPIPAARPIEIHKNFFSLIGVIMILPLTVAPFFNRHVHL